MHFKLAPMPKTPGQLLDLRIKQGGRGAKSKLARDLGIYFSTLNDWTKDLGFDEDNQRRAARALGEADDYFAVPDLTAIRERMREEVLAAFLATQLGQTATDEERRTLNSAKFFGGTPSQELYASWLLSMRGMLRRDPVDVARENASLSAQLAAKGDPFDTK